MGSEEMDIAGFGMCRRSHDTIACPHCGIYQKERLKNDRWSSGGPAEVTLFTQKRVDRGCRPSWLATRCGPPIQHSSAGPPLLQRSLDAKNMPLRSHSPRVPTWSEP